MNNKYSIPGNVSNVLQASTCFWLFHFDRASAANEVTTVVCAINIYIHGRQSTSG